MRKEQAFEVRYWAPSRIRRLFEEIVGQTLLEVDGYFTLNPQAADVRYLPPRVSEGLRKLSDPVPALVQAADSVYVRAVKRD